MSLPKCVETIDRLPHVGKEIVHPLEKSGTRVHHWDRYRLGHTSESAPGDRRCLNPDWGCDEHRQEVAVNRAPAVRKGTHGDKQFSVSPSLFCLVWRLA